MTQLERKAGSNLSLMCVFPAGYSGWWPKKKNHTYWIPWTERAAFLRPLSSSGSLRWPCQEMQREKNSFLVLPLWPAHRSPIRLAGVAEHLRKVDLHATETLPTETLQREVQQSSKLFHVCLNVNQAEMLPGTWGQVCGWNKRGPEACLRSVGAQQVWMLKGWRETGPPWSLNFLSSRGS